MGCGSGGQNSTVTQTTSPPPQVLAAYQALLNQGTAVSQLPLQQWQGPTIAGFNPTQQTAFGEVNQAQGAALPYINAAQTYLSAGAAPVLPDVMQWNPWTLASFENPYTQSVTQATQGLFDEQNAEQFNQARSSAASAGAFGGDREAVLEGEMARQQQLAEAPTLAGLQSQGFTTAAALLGQQQNLQLQGLEGDAWRAANAAGLESGLGSQAQGSLLTGASSELQTGALEQQLEQEQLNLPIQQFQQQQAYPFQTTDFLAGITEGVGPGMGANASTISPGPNLSGQLTGLGLTGLGLANQAGLFSGWGSGIGGATAAGGGLDTAAMFAGIAVPGASKRGGRIGFPSIRRAPGGFVPLDAGDLADADAAIHVASASPVSMPPPGGHPLPMTAPAVVASGSGSGSGGASSALGTIAQLAPLAMMFLRRGGRSPAHPRFPATFADGGETIDFGDPLIQIGAGMMASRSPYFLSQLGEGLRAFRSNEPRLEDRSPLVRVLYPNGRHFSSSLTNINAAPPGSPQPIVGAARSGRLPGAITEEQPWLSTPLPAMAGNWWSTGPSSPWGTSSAS